MTTPPRNPHNPCDDGADATPPPPPRDDLDGLLRQWHRANAEKAAAGRDRLIGALAQEGLGEAGDSDRGPFPIRGKGAARGWITVRSILFNRYVPLAAAAVVVAAMLPFMLPTKSGVVAPVHAKPDSNIVMVPEGGRLDALDREGNLMGPCALKHTDVKAEISGRFSRVTVTQRYHNPYPDKIEAVYTFPLSDRAGVDRMNMTIGDRVIVGEVKEREAARRVYEQAREAGRTASLLEQERPNIFTQSVANIDPGATINIEISYVETVAERDGELVFDFPTVVSPRYIPGAGLDSKQEIRPLPAGTKMRAGVVLAAPATVADAKRHGATSGDPGERTPEALEMMLARATPIATPEEDPTASTAPWYDVDVAYPDGSTEPAVILADGRGEVGGRWFYCPVSPPTAIPASGEPFAQPTDKVPDADRITPMPTRPNVRAGHDISISVTLDTGGPGITTLDSPLHKVVRTDLAKNALEQPRRVSIALASLNEIPNRDFVLRWKQRAETITRRVFTHTGEHGNFFALQLDAPARVDDVDAVPRELVFVADTSGSMNGRPMALSRMVMQKAIDAMRPQDTFNIVSFAGATRVLWERPRPNTPANRTAAQKFIESWEGSGGTEMMTAIETALRQTPSDEGAGGVTLAQLANLPADGRAVRVILKDGEIETDRMEAGGLIRSPRLIVREGVHIRCTDFTLPERFLKRADQTVADDTVTLRVLVQGTWTTENGERVLRADKVGEFYGDTGVRPLRIVMFLTDGEVGNDMAIIDAIRRNRATTRVFSFGIGNSVNRFLIDQMAIAGGGEPEYVFVARDSDGDADAAVERFNRRTRTPVLTDVTLTFDGVKPLDMLPAPGQIPDLFDDRPLTFLGRYTAAGVGAVTIKGMTARGRWERTIPIAFPAQEEQNSSLPVLWARAKIDAVMARDLAGIQAGHPSPAVRAEIVSLGETFNVMSPFTSFVAVDKLRVTIAGKPRLVRVPVELPDRTNWAGYFGGIAPDVRTRGPGDAEKRDDRSGKDLDARGAGDAAESAGRILTLNEVVLSELIAFNDSCMKQEDAARTGATGDKMVVGAELGLATGVPVSPTFPPPPPPPAPTAEESRDVPARPAGGQSPFVKAPSAKPADQPRGSSSRSEVAEFREKTKKATEASKLDGSGVREPDAGVDLPEMLRIRRRREPGLPWSRSADPADVQRTRTFGGYGMADARREALGKDAASPMLVPPHMMDFPTDWPVKTSMRGEYGGSVACDWDLLLANVDAPAPESLVALAAAQLAGEGRYAEAKSLACSNLAGNLNLALGNRAQGNTSNFAGNLQQSAAPSSVSQVCGALSSKLPEAEKQAAIEQARVRASTELLEARKAAMVYRKLAPELFARTNRAENTASMEQAPQTGNTRLPQSSGAGPKVDSVAATKDVDVPAAEAKIVDRKATETAVPAPAAATPGVLVTVLLADTTAATLDALKAIGFTIETLRPEFGVVIGRIPADKLEALALLAVVRRVEPVPDGGG